MKDYQTSTLKTYNDHAEDFEKTRSAFVDEERIDDFLTHLPGKRVLDLGCGPGRDVAVFVQKECQVTGVDFSKSFIQLAKNAVPDATFYEMNAMDLSYFSEGLFDGVWASASLLHLKPKDAQIAIQEVHRVLDTNGVFRVSLKKGNGDVIDNDESLGSSERYFYFYSEQEIKGILDAVGFEIIDYRESESRRKKREFQWIDIIAKKV